MKQIYNSGVPRTAVQNNYYNAPPPDGNGKPEAAGRPPRRGVIEQRAREALRKKGVTAYARD